MTVSATGTGSRDVVLADLIDEIMKRQGRGEPVSLGAYASKYPDQIQHLQELLPALQALADLSQSAGAAGSLKGGPSGDGFAPRETALSGGTLGDFRIVREIGRGGMGVVFEAEQISLCRRVALKMLPFAAVLDSRQLQRFQNEARAAASLKHPGIVQVYSVGCERGVHYYAMEYVEGRTLAEAIRQLRERPAEDSGREAAVKSSADQCATDLRFSAPLPLSPAVPPADTHRSLKTQVPTEKTPQTPGHFRTVADWGIQAAEALEHAHQLGVVHRDIKPSNLLIDAKGRLLVTDFGLAQIGAPSPSRGEGWGEGANLTLTGDILGTLRYMSPEQAQGNRQFLDHRTDIYSLGVTLYELLVLTPPFASHDRHALMHEIVESDPPPLRQLNSPIPRDLETIVLKAMAKEPQGRYATAQQLAEDLSRFLAHEPIRARRPSLADRTAKWARRHQPVVWSAIVTLVLAVLSLAVSMALIARAYQRESDQHRLADQQRALAEDREATLRRHLYEADVRLAHDAWKQAELPRAVEVLSGHIPKPGQTDLRGFEWHYVWGLCHQGQTAFSGHAGAIYCIAFSPDGRLLASAGEDGTVRLWDLAKRQAKAILKGHTGEVCCLAFSPDGATLATGGDDGRVRLWETASGKLLSALKGHKDDIFGLAFSPDGRLLASGGADDTAKLWDAQTQKQVRNLRAHTDDIQSLAFSPDGKTLATASTDRSIRLWDLATGKVRAELIGHADAVLCVAFSHDGKRLVTGGEDRTVRVWDPAAVQELAILQGHTSWVQGVAFAPDGRQVASASKDGTVRLWDVASRQQVSTIRGHAGRVWCLAFSPDGKTLATGGADGTIKLWDPAASQESQWSPEYLAGGLYLAFADDATLLACWPDRVTSWDLRTGWEIRPVANLPGEADRAAFSPDGRLLAMRMPLVGKMISEVILIDSRSRKALATLGRQPGGEELWFAFSPDSRTLALNFGDRTLQLWDVPERRQRLLLGLESTISDMAFSPDGRTLALARGNDLPVWLLDAETGEERGELRGHAGRANCVAFAPDGRTVATGGIDRTVLLWDAATSQRLATLVGHGDWVDKLAFSPDGKTLASASRDGTLRLWSVFSGRELVSTEATSECWWLAFSPDGKTLAGQFRMDPRPEVPRWRMFLWSGAEATEPLGIHKGEKKPPAGKEENKAR